MEITLKITLVSLFTLSVCLHPHVASSQSLHKIEKSAEREFWNENFAEALDAYQRILALEPDHSVALYRAEICSLLTFYPTKNLEDYHRYSSDAGSEDRFNNYWTGRINLKKHNFKAAIVSLNVFLNSEEYKSPEIIAEAKEFISKAKIAKKFYERSELSALYNVEHLDEHVNTVLDELSPTVCSENNLLFLSSRLEKKINHKKEKFAVYSSKKMKTDWSLPHHEYSFGYIGFDHESLSAYDNGNKIAFADYTNKGFLRVSEKKEGEWSEARLLDRSLKNLGIESRYCLSNDGQRLIFSSRKFNLRGDLDLYEIRKVNDSTWGEPFNLGAMVNSMIDEYSPYLSPDGKRLYFSSKGHGAIGGYDIFYAELHENGQSWTEPVHMEYPINTIDDDIHLVLDKTGGGYFASDRYGTNGGFDIFHFTSSIEEDEKIADVNKGVVNDPR